MIKNDLKPTAFLTDETHYILVEDYEYQWHMVAVEADTGEKVDLLNTIRVREGFRWDGASVPEILWAMGFKPDGPHRAAALIHDYIYIHKGKLPEGSIISSYNGKTDQVQHGSFSRKDADRMFGHMMKEARVHPFRRDMMKWAVTLFGWIYWKDGPDVLRNTILKFIVFAVLLFSAVMVIGRL